MQPAPDFNSGFPSQGERLGPAWQAIWNALEDGQPRTWRELHAIGNEALNALGLQELKQVSVRNLINKASSKKLLKRDLRPPSQNGKRAPAVYWREIDAVSDAVPSP